MADENDWAAEAYAAFVKPLKERLDMANELNEASKKAIDAQRSYIAKLEALTARVDGIDWAGIQLTADAADSVEIVILDGKVYQRTRLDRVVEITDPQLAGACRLLANARGAVAKLDAKPARHLSAVPTDGSDGAA
jgi:hypothetical protein